MFNSKLSVLRIILVASLALLALAGCSDDDSNDVTVNNAPNNGVNNAPNNAPNNAAQQSIVEIATSSDDFSTLVQALQAADLVSALEGDGPFTVFAPTNAAFEALLSAEGITAEQLLADPGLAAILTFHVVPGNLSREDVAGASLLTTLEGSDIKVATLDDGTVTVAGARISATTVEATNGVIHVLEGVMTPPPTLAEIVTSDENFSTLLAAVVEADLAATLSDPSNVFTVFAPTNAAFEALLGALEISPEELLADPNLADILLFHVVEGRVPAEDVVAADALTTVQGSDASIEINGETVTIEGATIIAVDIPARGGSIVHVIDNVIIPELEEPPSTITDIAAGSDQLTTLVAALQATDLDVVLDDEEGAFTVFAPTDDAFAAALAALEITAEDLLADPNLSSILLYHVVGEALLAAEITDRTMLSTENGAPVDVTVEGETVLINDATVIEANIQASNGVIHIIDAVLLPPVDQPSIAEIVANDDDFSILLLALEEAELDTVLADEDATFTVFAPTDDAFAAALAALDITAEDLLADPNLANILLYHVAGEALLAEDVVGRSLITTASGIDAKVTVEGETVKINEATITDVNIEASNGIIHVLDAVLLPPGTIADIVVNDDNFSILEQAVIEADLAGTLGDTEQTFTVFAPTDDAFAAALAALDITAEELLANPELANILLYHVVPGRVPAADVLSSALLEMASGIDARITIDSNEVRINNAVITVTDIPAANGIIHVIDAVILPPGTIADVVTANPDFSILLQAVVEADLATTLADTETQFTVFAPTNDAFEALLAELGLTLEELLADAGLANILLYHVIQGEKLSSTELLERDNVTTAQGETAALSVNGERLLIEGATVIDANIPASNGIIHVIDAVLTPPM